MSDELLKRHTPTVYKEFRQHDSIREIKGRLDSECDHRFWSKKCSVCLAIMESDAKKNLDVGDKTRIQYTDFDKLVCNEKLSLKIKDLKIPQRSRLYWVHGIDNDIVTLRTYENVLLRGNIVSSAFTSSELIRLLSKLPRGTMSPNLWEQVGRDGHDPNRLARLFIKLKNLHE